MKTLAASLSILTREGVMLYLLRGVAFTCIISVLGVIMGLIVGSLLALARTYCKKGPTRILGWFATAYIELFRNTPYLLWIFICVVFCPCPGFFARKMFGLTSVEMKLLFKAALALILFNSSVIAEIVRGGLNGVSKGQFEAGYAHGRIHQQYNAGWPRKGYAGRWCDWRCRCRDRVPATDSDFVFLHLLYGGFGIYGSCRLHHG